MLHFQSKHLTVFQSALYQTTTAIVEAEEVIIMTDPNWLAEEIEEIRAFLHQRLGNRELYIIYTHSDYDHVIGSGAFPHAKVIASEELVQNPEKKATMKRIRAFDQQYYVKRNYTPVYPRVDIVISNQHEKIQLGDLTLSFYKAPGHTKDGLFTVVESFGIFLAGDYLSDVEFPFIFDSYSGYIETMNTAASILEEHQIDYLVPGHGSVATNAQNINERVRFAKYYLEQLVKDPEALENECREKYTFFEGMQHLHAENQEMVRKESGKFT